MVCINMHESIFSCIPLPITITRLGEENWQHMLSTTCHLRGLRHTFGLKLTESQNPKHHFFLVSLSLYISHIHLQITVVVYYMCSRYTYYTISINTWECLKLGMPQTISKTQCKRTGLGHPWAPII